MNTTDAMQLYSVRQAAELAAVSVSTLYVLMERGALAYVKLGRSRRIERRAIAELIERGRVPARA